MLVGRIAMLISVQIAMHARGEFSLLIGRGKESRVERESAHTRVILNCVVDRSYSRRGQIVDILAVGELLFTGDVVEGLVPLNRADECNSGPISRLLRFAGVTSKRRCPIQSAVLHEDESVAVYPI
jgi:hypothetical protein